MTVLTLSSFNISCLFDATDNYFETLLYTIVLKLSVVGHLLSLEVQASKESHDRGGRLSQMTTDQCRATGRSDVSIRRVFGQYIRREE